MHTPCCDPACIATVNVVAFSVQVPWQLYTEMMNGMYEFDRIPIEATDHYGAIGCTYLHLLDCIAVSLQWCSVASIQLIDDDQHYNCSHIRPHRVYFAVRLSQFCQSQLFRLIVFAEPHLIYVRCVDHVDYGVVRFAIAYANPNYWIRLNCDRRWICGRPYLKGIHLNGCSMLSYYFDEG